MLRISYSYFSKLNVLAIIFLVTTAWLDAQNNLDSISMAEKPVYYDCFRDARKTAIENNLTIREMYALCEATHESDWIQFGSVRFGIEEAGERTYNEAKLDALKQTRTELVERLATPVIQAQIDAWRNKRKYVIYYGLERHEPLARKEIAALDPDNLRIVRNYTACTDNINRAKNKEHITIYTVEETEETISGLEYSIAKLEAN